ncbi:MAG: competence/damage-inducible protein A [Melioribacteraceae bacterium]|nr:competence/damage-inducible protein A [Melioribacteraceae bacterium]
MKAQIISIGDELLIGKTLNTNAAFIGNLLTENQINVTKISVVGDDEQSIKDAFEYSSKNFDVAIVTGGLGPTHDDITMKCIKEFFETELIENEKILENIKSIFARRGREVTDINKEQALVPKCSEPIPNIMGTAPGSWIEKDGWIFISMPGVPSEMEMMFSKYVLPKLIERRGEVADITKSKTFSTTGIPESTLFEKLGDLTTLLNGGKVAFLPNQFGVKVRVNATAATNEEADNKITEIEQRIRTIVGRYIYTCKEETLEEVVARLLTDRGLTIATAESCTGGALANRLTNISGSSIFFNRGVVTYSNGAKVELLRVDEDMIDKHGAVSIEVARQMAEGIRSTSGTDIGIATTGIMGPKSDFSDKPVGLVYIGICDENMVTAKEFRFGENRLLNKDRTSQAALEMLRRCILGIEYDQ